MTPDQRLAEARNLARSGLYQEARQTLSGINTEAANALRAKIAQVEAQRPTHPLNQYRQPDPLPPLRQSAPTVGEPVLAPLLIDVLYLLSLISLGGAVYFAVRAFGDPREAENRVIVMLSFLGGALTSWLLATLVAYQRLLADRARQTNDLLTQLLDHERQR